MTARFEVVRTDAVQPWHARFRAANGRIVWTTEQYARRAGALTAIASIAGAFSESGYAVLRTTYVKILIDWPSDRAHSVDIAYLDERADHA